MTKDKQIDKETRDKINSAIEYAQKQFERDIIYTALFGQPSQDPAVLSKSNKVPKNMDISEFIKYNSKHD